MGTMDKIRQTSPFLLGIVAVLFIGFMVISDMNIGNLMSNQDPTKSAIGTVNGEDILYAEFESRVQQYVENQRQRMGPDADIDDDPIRQQVWNEMVDEIIMRQEAEKLGVNVTDEELSYIMLNEPPAEWRQGFMDSTGRFMRDVYIDIMKNNAIDKYIKDPEAAANFRKQVFMIEDYVRQTRLRKNLQDAIAATVSALPPTYLQQQYKVAGGSAEVSYVVVNTASVRDQDVQVSDAEVEAYYNKNKEYFKQKPSRQLKYVAFPEVASKQDTANAERKINRLSDSLRVVLDPARRNAIFDKAVEDYNGETHSFQLVKDIDPLKYNYLLSVPEKEIVGPVRLNDGMYFFRVDGRRSGTNEVVKASHILIPFGNNKDSAKAEATRIAGLAKGGEDFATLAGKYSADKGSAQRGGDLGFFGKGQMVKPFEDAAFTAAPGTITDLVETEYGYHIIKVEDKKSEELAFTEIRIKPTMSNVTRNEITSMALKVKSEVESGKSIDDVAKANKLEVSLSGFFGRNTPVLGSTKLAIFAFSQDQGAVSDPVVTKQLGTVVAQISDVRTEGLKSLADMKEEIRVRLIRLKKLDKIKSQAEEFQRKIAAAGSMEAAKAMDSTLGVETITVKNNGQVPGLGMEPAFTHAAFTAPLNAVSGVVRGERAYFVIQVKNRTEANMAAFEAQRADIYKAQVERMKNSAFYMWLQAVKDKAKIEDNRAAVYNM